MLSNQRQKVTRQTAPLNFHLPERTVTSVRERTGNAFNYTSWNNKVLSIAINNFWFGLAHDWFWGSAISGAHVCCRKTAQWAFTFKASEVAHMSDPGKSLLASVCSSAWTPAHHHQCSNALWSETSTGQINTRAQCSAEVFNSPWLYMRSGCTSKHIKCGALGWMALNTM